MVEKLRRPDDLDQVLTNPSAYQPAYPARSSTYPTAPVSRIEIPNVL